MQECASLNFALSNLQTTKKEAAAHAAVYNILVMWKNGPHLELSYG